MRVCVRVHACVCKFFGRNLSLCELKMGTMMTKQLPVAVGGQTRHGDIKRCHDRHKHLFKTHVRHRHLSKRKARVFPRRFVSSLCSPLSTCFLNVRHRPLFGKVPQTTTAFFQTCVIERVRMSAFWCVRVSAHVCEIAQYISTSRISTITPNHMHTHKRTHIHSFTHISTLQKRWEHYRVMLVPHHCVCICVSGKGGWMYVYICTYRHGYRHRHRHRHRRRHTQTQTSTRT